jgi:hypothetical protein
MEWVGRRRAGIVMRFDAADAQVLRGLVAAVLDMVGDAPAGRPAAGAGAPVDPLEEILGPDFGDSALGGGPAPPRDPVLARLLPDGYRDDPESAGEFRRLTEASLRQHKRDTARRVLDSLPPRGGRVCLDRATTRAWLSALNDVRLVIGTRLDVTEDMDVPEPDDPAAPGYQLYRWLSLLQELLVEAVTGESRPD